MIMVVMIFADRACGVGLVGLSCDYGGDDICWPEHVVFDW